MVTPCADWAKLVATLPSSMIARAQKQAEKAAKLEAEKAAKHQEELAREEATLLRKEALKSDAKYLSAKAAFAEQEKICEKLADDHKQAVLCLTELLKAINEMEA